MLQIPFIFRFRPKFLIFASPDLFTTLVATAVTTVIVRPDHEPFPPGSGPHRTGGGARAGGHHLPGKEERDWGR